MPERVPKSAFSLVAGDGMNVLPKTLVELVGSAVSSPANSFAILGKLDCDEAAGFPHGLGEEAAGNLLPNQPQSVGGAGFPSTGSSSLIGRGVSAVDDCFGVPPNDKGLMRPRA